MTPLTPQALQAFRDTLTARAKTLRGELGAVEADRNQALATARETVEDAGDQAETRRGDEVRSAEEQRDQVELADVDAAMGRLDAGSFGACVDCGVGIPMARLKAQPAAARCIVCQEKSEKAALAR